MNGISEEKRILVVGLCCLDICNYIDQYPQEDTDNQVFEQTWRLGGNAYNNMAVLKQLNKHSEMMAVLPENDPIVENQLKKNPINTSKCIRHPNFDFPLSTIIISRDTGSRTIFHCRGTLVEPNMKEFQEKIPKPEDYSWIHFEGRNHIEVKKMLEYIYERKKNLGLTRPKISLEVELSQMELEKIQVLEGLIPYADVIFMSKDYARIKGWSTKIEAVEKMFHEVATHKPLVICPWGDQGCAAIDSSISEEVINIDGYHPEKVLDTLAAGDCFIASSIHFLNQDLPTAEALKLATKVAGIKVGQKGVMNLPLNFLNN